MGQQLRRPCAAASALRDVAKPQRHKLVEVDGDECPEVAFGQRPPAAAEAAAAAPPAIFEGGDAAVAGRHAVRDRFLSKLSSSGAWAPRERRAPHHETVTVFDWDDTILCTSHILQGRGVTHSMAAKLHKIAAIANELLTKALDVGHVFVITNGVEGWVQQSASLYLPSLVPVLSRVRIISARSRFERHFPGCLGEWKVQALLELHQELGGAALANLISVGDSEFDLEAMRIMGRQFPHAAVKTVKMWDEPSPEEIKEQLRLLLRDYDTILSHPGSAEIAFRRASRDRARAPGPAAAQQVPRVPVAVRPV